MMKPFLLAAMVSAVPVCLVSAQDAKVSVDMIGIGAMSCAHWRSTKEHSFGRNRLDLRLLDRTQLRCSGEWSITGENQYVRDSGRSRKNMRSANIANISRRRVDHVRG
jgi:hypothetical protein